MVRCLAREICTLGVFFLRTVRSHARFDASFVFFLFVTGVGMNLSSFAIKAVWSFESSLFERFFICFLFASVCIFNFFFCLIFLGSLRFLFVTLSFALFLAPLL